MQMLFKTGHHLDSIEEMEHNNNIHKELLRNYEKNSIPAPGMIANFVSTRPIFAEEAKKKSKLVFEKPTNCFNKITGT